MQEDSSMITKAPTMSEGIIFRMPALTVCMSVAFLLPNSAVSQVDSFEQAFNERYEHNIQLERIRGVYIPVDMKDAFVELERLSEPQAVLKFKQASEDMVSRKLHFGLGRWMVTNWNFYNGSRFSHYLKEMGVSHPDDMAQFTIVSWHRHLNGKELGLEARAKEYARARQALAGKKDTVPAHEKGLPESDKNE